MDSGILVLGVLGLYLLLGVAAIGVLDIVTGRVRSRLKGAIAEIQVLTGENRILAVIVTALALWIFWPAAIWAAIRG